MRSKTNYLIFFNVLPLSFVLLIFTACSSSQTVGTSLERQERSREKIIESRIKKDLGSDSTNYESIAFGKLLVTKPDSFYPLDSMYRLKTELLKNRSKNYYELERLEEAIDIKRLELQPELSKIIYEQEHVYAVKNDSTVEVHEVMVNLKDQKSVNYISLLNQHHFDERLLANYKLFFFNLPFIVTYYYYPSQEEMDFYQLYKTRYEEIIDEEEKNDFLIHTLQVMKRSQSIRSLSVKRLVEKELNEQFKRNFDIINFEVEELANGETVAYYCVIEFTDGKDPQFQEFRYDVYLRKIEF